MIANKLLERFDLLGDAPETILQLRKLIVMFAITRKLSSSEEDQLTVSTILEQAEKVKRQLIQRGVIGKQKPFPPIAAEDLPSGFSDPDTFVRLDTISRIEKGPTGIQGTQPGPYPLVVTAENRSSCDHFDFEGPAAIVPLVSSTGHGKASLHRLHYQEGKFALGSILAAIFPFAPHLISARFLFEYLSAFKEELFVSRMSGTANVSLSIGKIAEVPVPIVSPSVQRRVDELMALCDELERARAEREARRDRLAAAAWARLSAPDGDAQRFRDDAAFALKYLAALTARPEQVKALRQTILNLAVRGRLVAQDAADEPASELLRRIAAEKAQVKGAARNNGTSLLASIVASDLPFELGKGWQAVTIAQILLELQTGPFGSSLHQSDYQIGGIPVINPASIQNERIVPIDKMAVGQATLQRLSTFMLREGDIVMARRGEMGRCAVVTKEEAGWLCGTGSLILRLPKSIFARFIMLLIGSPYVRDYLGGSAVGATMQNLNQSILLNLVVGLPPFAEQRRIVAKVDELMALCDALEASLAAGGAARRRLLEAVLHGAVAG